MLGAHSSNRKIQRIKLSLLQSSWSLKRTALLNHEKSFAQKRTRMLRHGAATYKWKEAILCKAIPACGKRAQAAVLEAIGVRADIGKEGTRKQKLHVTNFGSINDESYDKMQF
ncbi:hypothetical protein Tco_0602423 [Tanacetum coccineum]